MTIHEHLKRLTSHVRITQGSGAALLFYIDYIQPIHRYFGGEARCGLMDLQGTMEAELLDRYTKFLQREGYCDSDATEEHPTAVEQFLKKKGHE